MSFCASEAKQKVKRWRSVFIFGNGGLLRRCAEELVFAHNLSFGRYRARSKRKREKEEETLLMEDNFVIMTNYSKFYLCTVLPV